MLSTIVCGAWLLLLFCETCAIDVRSETDRVVDLPGLPDSLHHLRQYAGFLNASTPGIQGNLFYWLVETEGAVDEADSAPLILWLQGGPGASSLFGLFSENGPFRVNSVTGDPELVEAQVRWTTVAHMLYLDQPFGTGFSFAENASSTSVVHDEEQLRDAAVAALLDFFHRHPRFAGRQFYIFGESFAGHMAPNIAWRLMQMKDEQHDGTVDDSVFPINLLGLAIGDGWVDPVAQNKAFPDYAFATGLIGDEMHASLAEQADQCVRIIDSGNYTKAFHGPCYYQMLNPIVKAAGNISPYDIRVFSSDVAEQGCGNVTLSQAATWKVHPHDRRNDASDRLSRRPQRLLDFGADALQRYLDTDIVRDAIHVPRASASAPWGKGLGSELVEEALVPDLNAPTSLPLWPSLLARGIQILVYNGNFDLICNHLGTDAYVRQLQWPGRASFLRSQRSPWRVQSQNGFVAGWARSGGNLTQVVVANAGHMAPADAPEACFDMLQRFLHGLAFTKSCSGDEEVLHV